MRRIRKAELIGILVGILGLLALLQLFPYLRGDPIVAGLLLLLLVCALAVVAGIEYAYMKACAKADGGDASFKRNKGIYLGYAIGCVISFCGIYALLEKFPLPKIELLELPVGTFVGIFGGFIGAFFGGAIAIVVQRERARRTAADAG